MLIERPQAVNTKCLEGGNPPPLEIGHPEQTVCVIYTSSNSAEDPVVGGGDGEDGGGNL